MSNITRIKLTSNNKIEIPINGGEVLILSAEKREAFTPTKKQREALANVSKALYELADLAGEDDNFNDELSTIEGYTLSLDELAYNFLMASQK